MKIEWDENKNRVNIKKHGFDFSDAERVFLGELPFLYHLDTREDYGEDRWIGMGVLDGMVVVVIIFSEPETGTVRIISMRKASTNERKKYQQAVTH